MINTVTFENMSGKILRPYEELGALLVEYDAPPPAPITHYVDVDGADGAIDLSEWAGEIKYGVRTVTAVLRDLGPLAHNTISQFVTGRKIKITFSDQPDVYFIGRCVDNVETTRKRVTNQKLTFTCEPYKCKHILTKIRKSLSETSADILLKAARKSVIPTITSTDECVIVWNNNTYTLNAGTHTIPQIVITDEYKTLQASGAGTLTIEWRDGVL